MKDAILIDDLEYFYGKKRAVKIDSLRISTGDLYGIIGADGAGKTTLYRLLASLYKPKKGKISIFGEDTVKDYKKIRQFTGYMPSKFSLYEDLSIKENMEFFASIFASKLEDNYGIVEDIYSMLRPFEKRRAGKLSGGMKQKLALCTALIHRPRILLLDEPTTGVDPVSRQEFWEMLLKLQASGITIIVSTPYLDEAKLCNKIALMHKSEILLEGSLADFQARFSRKIYYIRASDNRSLTEIIRKYENTYSVFSFGDSLHYIAKYEKNDDEQIRDLHSYLASFNIRQVEIERVEASLEDIFIDYLQGATDDN